MIEHNLPKWVEIDGERYHITNDCDYRVVLDAISALNDGELSDAQKVQCALYVFYDDLSQCLDGEAAIEKMYDIMRYNDKEDAGERKEASSEPRLMDWDYDFPLIAPPINTILGYDIRDPDKYTHWYTFMGAYMEIDQNSLFSQITTLRRKLQKGAKLEKSEREFYERNRLLVNLPLKLSTEDTDWLNGED